MKKILLLLTIISAFLMVACNILEDDEPNKPYTLTFMLSETEVYATYPVDIGDEMIWPENPSLEGYIFSGWFAEGGPFTSNYVEAGALVLIAHFDVEDDDRETVNVSLYDGSFLFRSLRFEKGSTLPSIDTLRPGYEFIAWYTNSSLTILFDLETIIETNLILYGKWEADYNYTGYYADISIRRHEPLVDVLNDILRRDFINVSYGDARYILENSDRDPLQDNTVVRGMYNNDEIATYWIGQGAGAWQREHVWPNSKLGISRVSNNSRNQGSDLHNLRAITGINQTRSNRYFVQGSGAAVTVGSQGFYPGDDHKGDVARILFYMFVMYDFLTLTDDEILLGNNSSTNYTMAGTYAGKLSLLLQWHIEDPVDEFEMQRNEFIYSGVAPRSDGAGNTVPQGNRNPFIDHPELAHYIWGGTQSLSVNGTSFEYTPYTLSYTPYSSFNHLYI